MEKVYCGQVLMYVRGMKSWIDRNISNDVAEYLFTIKVNSLPERIGVFQRNVKGDVAIDYEMLEEQLQEIPEIIAFWDQLLAEQRAQVGKFESMAEVHRGTITKRVLEEARAVGMDVRRSDLDDLINADDEMIKDKTVLINERKKEEKLRSVIGALRIKADALRSLAGFKREEKKE